MKEDSAIQTCHGHLFKQKKKVLLEYKKQLMKIKDVMAEMKHPIGALIGQEEENFPESRTRG